MHLSVGQISLIDLVGQLERKEVVINRDYQREAGVWPISARTYFIDTILEGYPFPKIYLYQLFNPKSKRPIKEIVDGQQRISTILDFLDNKLILTSESKNFVGFKYIDLSEEEKQKFQSYQIETSVILSATRAELLEMFRRMNAYTAPLSAAEKRHSMYQGAFKWFIVEQADQFSHVFEELQILTAKQLARMADAEFIADMIVALEMGVVTKTPKQLENLYKQYDVDFVRAKDYQKVLKNFFEFITGPLQELSDTFIMKSYVIHSLFCAYAHLIFGVPGMQEKSGVHPNPHYPLNYQVIIQRLRELADAHERQDETGPHAEYVKCCLSSTTKQPQRLVRVRVLLNALMN